MAYSPQIKAILILQLSFIVAADSLTPTHRAMSPSAQPLPHSVPRKLVAVQGVVYCKSCKYVDVETLSGAKPINGSSVGLNCSNTKKPLFVNSTTDQHGYFRILAPKTLSTFGIRKCRVSLVASGSTNCSKPSNLNGGYGGAPWIPAKNQTLPGYVLFNVGPFAFEPKKKCSLSS